MRIIHKAVLKLTDHVNLDLPRKAQILAFQEHHGEPVIWYMFNDAYVGTEERRFWIIGTGNSFTANSSLEYFGTWQFSNGLVWHLFEDVRP